MSAYGLLDNVNLKTTSNLTWPVGIPSQDLRRDGEWILRFVPNGTFSAYIQEEGKNVPSPLFYVLPSDGTTTSASASEPTSSPDGAPDTAPGSSTTSTSTISDNTPTPTPSADEVSNALSTGAKAGIGVGIGVGVVLSVAALLFFLIARRKGQLSYGWFGRSDHPADQDGLPVDHNVDRNASEGNFTGVPPASSMLPELRGQELSQEPQKHELPQESQTHELEGNRRLASELDS